MTVSLPKKVPLRQEPTGTARGDRAQLQARDVAKAHEITKAVVAALANRAYAALLVDAAINIAPYATLLSVPITTTLAKGFLVITWSAAAGNTAACSLFFQVLVDNVVQKGTRVDVVAGGGSAPSMVLRVPVVKGAHTVLLQWKTNVNGAHCNAFTTLEEHASLLVQEVP